MGTDKPVYSPGTGTEGGGHLSAANRVPGHFGLNHQHLIIRPLLGLGEQGPVCKEAPDVPVAGTRGLGPLVHLAEALKPREPQPLTLGARLLLRRGRFLTADDSCGPPLASRTLVSWSLGPQHQRPIPANGTLFGCLLILGIEARRAERRLLQEIGGGRERMAGFSPTLVFKIDQLWWVSG